MDSVRSDVEYRQPWIDVMEDYHHKGWVTMERSERYCAVESPDGVSDARSLGLRQKMELDMI